MNEYLEKLNRFHYNKYTELEEYAKINKVPIIQYESLICLLSFIKSKNVKNILELGTAISYSALQMSEISNDIYIDTIERDEQMYAIAKENVKKYHKESQINLIFDDCLLVDCNTLKKYDLIFIDAAKAQYEKFFLKFAPLLNESGIIITDNILFHGMVEDVKNKETSVSKNVKNLAKKIDNYNLFLNNNTDFETFYIDIGDGLAISMRKHHE